MLMSHQMLTLNSDNAMSNNKQTTCLHALPNSFDQVNHVRCFNHTIQLSAKGLLKPFSASVDKNNDTAAADDDDDHNNHNDVPPALKDIEDEEDVDEDEEDDDDNDKKEDALNALSAEDREALLENMVAVRSTLDKVR
jgi:hypothetical protein